MGIFRAYDIRGRVPEDLNPNKIRKIGKAIGTYLLENNRKRILVGRDIRNHSKKLERALIKGVKSTGAEIYRVGEQPFGILFFAVEKDDLDALLFVTGSHLGRDWNGVKIFYKEGTAPSKSEWKEIKRIYNKSQFKKGKGKVKKLKKMREAYIRAAKESFDLNGLRVVLDCFNGAASLVAPKLFRSLGAEVKTLYGEVDGSFSNKKPVPSSENLDKMRKAVGSFDIGIAYDGDGDRAVFMDDKGRVLLPSQIGAFIANELGKGKIITNVGCSMILEEEFGRKRVKRIPVGHTYLTKYCKKYDPVIGLESSGHYIIPSISNFDDGILVSAKVASLLKQKNQKLSEVWKNYKPYPKTQINFRCPDEKKFKIVEKLKNRFKERYEKVVTIDGVRVDLDKGWFLIRASNTSPKIRLYVEAKTKSQMEEIVDKFGGILEKEIGSETGALVKKERKSE